MRESPWRVALIASSSWSHAFLTDKNHQLYPDIEADRRLYEALRVGDYDTWRDRAAGRHRGVGPAGDAQLVHAGRRHGGARPQARRVRLRRDVVVQLQQVLRGVHSHETTFDTRQRRSPAAPTAPVNGAIPKLSGDIRPLIPKLGLRNYWYPAVTDKKVGARKPVKVALLGEEICLFRGATGAVAAIQDVCPHRGARLSEGDCHYRGTVACPYHGWVFDESGKNVAVLSEGPDSGRVRQAGHRGEGLPDAHAQGRGLRVDRRRASRRPIEQDVPEEFFDDDALVHDRPGLLALQLGGRARELDGLARELRAPQRGRGRARRLHRAGRPGRAPALRGQRLRRRRGREQLHAPQPAPRTSTPNGWKWPKTNYRRVLDVDHQAAGRSRPAQHPAAEVGAMVRRPPPARHVPRRVRLGPLHAHVRAGRGAPDAGLVLPLHAAEERAPAVLGPG